MSSEEEKPPAPPVRLTSNRSVAGGVGSVGGVGGVGSGVGGIANDNRVVLLSTNNNNIGDSPPVDMRPLPKGNLHSQLHTLSLALSLSLYNSVVLNCRAWRCRSQKEDSQEQDQGSETLSSGCEAEHLLSHQFWAYGTRGIRCGDRWIYGKFSIWQVHWPRYWHLPFAIYHLMMMMMRIGLEHKLWVKRFLLFFCCLIEKFINTKKKNS